VEYTPHDVAVAVVARQTDFSERGLSLKGLKLSSRNIVNLLYISISIFVFILFA